MKRCKCASYAGSMSMFQGGRMHWNWWMSGVNNEGRAHHPSCEKYDAIEQLKLVEEWIEGQHTWVREVRGVLERRQREAKARRLKLV